MAAFATRIQTSATEAQNNHGLNGDPVPLEQSLVLSKGLCVEDGRVHPQSDEDHNKQTRQVHPRCSQMMPLSFSKVLPSDATEACAAAAQSALQSWRPMGWRWIYQTKL